MNLPQCVFLEGDYRIAEELFLFSGIAGRRMWPEGNRELKRKAGASHRVGAAVILFVSGAAGVVWICMLEQIRGSLQIPGEL